MQARLECRRHSAPDAGFKQVTEGVTGRIATLHAKCAAQLRTPEPVIDFAGISDTGF